MSTTDSSSPKLIVVISALATIYFVWGSTYLALKYAVAGIPPFMIVGLRNLLAGLILFPLVFKSLRSGVTLAHLKTAMFTGLLLIVGGNGSVTYAQSHGVPSAVAALIVGLVPSWMTVFAFMNQKNRQQNTLAKLVRILGLSAGVIGLGVLVAKGALTTNGGTWAMTAILVFGTVTWAYGSVRAKFLQSHPDLLTATALSMVAGGLIAILLGAFLGEVPLLLEVPLSSITSESLFGFAYLVVFGSVLAFSVYGWLLKNVDPSLTGTYAYVNPLVAMALGYFIGGEQMGASMLIAGALIIVSVILITVASRLDRNARLKLAAVASSLQLEAATAPHDQCTTRV